MNTKALRALGVDQVRFKTSTFNNFFDGYGRNATGCTCLLFCTPFRCSVLRVLVCESEAGGDRTKSADPVVRSLTLVYVDVLQASQQKVVLYVWAKAKPA